MDAANDLLNDLQQNDGLTVLQLYRLGLVLDQATKEDTSNNIIKIQRLQQVTRDVLGQLSGGVVWESLESALTTVLNSQKQAEITLAVGAVGQLYRHTDERYPSAQLLTEVLLPRAATEPALLVCLAEFILKEREFEVFLPIVCDVQELPLWSNLQTHLTQRVPSGWKKTVLSNFDETHHDYLSSILDSKGGNDDKKNEETVRKAVASVQATGDGQRSAKATSTTTSPEQELSRRISQVQSVFPSFGEGFIEVALSQFQGDVETTVARLLDNDEAWPAALQRLDRNLPRRLRSNDSIELDDSTRAILKANLQASTLQEEKDAYLLEVAMQHDEYDDDYDDQYDDIDGVGNVDQPDDFEAIRVYNRALKGIVEEQGFWDDNRNTNRDRKPPPKSVQKQNKSGDDDTNTNTEEGNGESTSSKKYRGPDKMRGGRIPGQGRGRGAGRGGRGRGPPPAATTATGEGGSAAGDGAKPSSGKPNLKSKQRKLDKRRDKQKQAQQKRTG